LSLVPVADRVAWVVPLDLHIVYIRFICISLGKCLRLCPRKLHIKCKVADSTIGCRNNEQKLRVYAGCYAYCDKHPHPKKASNSVDKKIFSAVFNLVRCKY